MLAQVLDGRSDQVLTGFRVGHQLGEASRTFVPATDGQQSSQILIVSFESVEFGVAPFDLIIQSLYGLD